VESGDKTTVPITLSVRNSGWRMVVTISGFDTRKSVEIEGSVYSGAPWGRSSMGEKLLQEIRRKGG
jgi:hypothetical protein